MQPALPDRRPPQTSNWAVILLAAQSARAMAARLDRAQHPAVAAEIIVQSPARLAALLLAQHPDQLEARRRRGLHLRDLRRLLDQELVGEARLVGEALDLVGVRDPGVAGRIGHAQAAPRRAVGAGHRIGRDREAALMRLMGLIGGAGGEQRGDREPPQAGAASASRLIGLCWDRALIVAAPGRTCTVPRLLHARGRSGSSASGALQRCLCFASAATKLIVDQ